MTTKCKNCGSNNTCHSEIGGENSVPEESSISVCFSCAALAKYKDKEMIPLSVDERTELMMEYPDVWDNIIIIQHKIREFAKYRELTKKNEV